MHRKSLVSLIILVLTLSGCTNKPAVLPQTVLSTPPTSTTTIQITNTGFEPATISVKRGTTLTWKNSDTATHLIASDPYPTETGLAGFNSRETVAPGGSYSFTFTKVGNWSYHDRLRPTMYTGTVIVAE